MVKEKNNKNQDKNNTNTDNNTTTLDRIMEKLENLDTKVTNIGTQLKDLTEKFSEMEEDVHKNTEEIANIKTNMKENIKTVIKTEEVKTSIKTLIGTETNELKTKIKELEEQNRILTNNENRKQRIITSTMMTAQDTNQLNDMDTLTKQQGSAKPIGKSRWLLNFPSTQKAKEFEKEIISKNKNSVEDEWL